MLSAPPALTPKEVVKSVAVAADAYTCRATESASVLPTIITDLGAAPYGWWNVIVVSQVEAVPPVPVVIVNEPAESVAPVSIAAVGVVPQLVGVPIDGGVVCVELKCAFASVSVAKEVSEPLTVITELVVSADSNVVLLLF